MAGFLPVTSDRIVDLASELVLSLELQRGEGCDLTATGQATTRLIDLMHGAVVAAEDIERPGATARVDDVARMVQAAYVNWKNVDAALAQTIRLAYENQIPRSNLLLDDIRTSLRQQAGEPVAQAYTTLRRRWADHVDSRPWDSYRDRAPAHVERDALESALSALARGDDLDVEDAMTAITGDLRYAFADHIAAHPNDAEDIEIGLWKRPEILVAGDFWGHAKRLRLVDVIAENGSERSRATAGLLSTFFASNQKGAASVVRGIHDVHESQRERFTRCLMLHPDYEVRRYAVNNTDIASVWKVVTPENVPCATILTLLERLVGSSRYTTAQRKIFFDTVYRRLLTLTSRSDVLYARGIARILVKLNFFLEDRYFQRLIALLDYLSVKEQAHGIQDGVLSEYSARIRHDKQRAGSVMGEEPGFDGIPLVVLRKMARDGHYWHLLVTHPVAKIARELVPHISTRDRALVTARNHRVNPEVLRGLGRRRELFSGHSARMALLANPQTPVAVSTNYLSDLSLQDVEALLRRSTVHPELRHILRTRLAAVQR
jgi:hypothetical protein